MRINWKVRVKNPFYWIGLAALFFCTIGVDASTLTSWSVLADDLKAFISNPFAIGSAIVAFITYNNDPTTTGLGDTKTALSYKRPKNSNPLI